MGTDSGMAASDRQGASRLLWLTSLAAWTVLGLLESATAWVRVRGTPVERGWWDMLYANMPWWLIWALLTPPVVLLVRRVPLHGARWRRGVAVHLVAGFVVSSVHLLAEGIVYYYSVSRYNGMPTLLRQWRMFFVNFLVLDVVTYWLIALGAHAAEYYRRYRATALESARLEARAARLELGLAEARMQALRMELNPHFLFNTLNAVSGLVRREENEAAVRMLAQLGDLLRSALDRELAPAIPLREELGLLEQYLEIERVRFGERLVVSVSADEEAWDALVPTLVLQPLVENSIRHGVARVPGRSRIDVIARRDGASLVLVVRDTGEGLGNGNGAPEREGVGLSNTRARLAALYGAGAALTLEDSPGGGACTTIVCPYRAEVVVHA